MHLSRFQIFNTPNNRIWGTEKAKEFQEHALNSEKVTFLWDMNANGLLKPFYIDIKQSRKTIITIC